MTIPNGPFKRYLDRKKKIDEEIKERKRKERGE